MADGPWDVQDLVAKRSGFGPAGRFFIGALEEGCEGLEVSGDGSGIAVIVMIGDDMSSGSTVEGYSKENNSYISFLKSPVSLP